MTPSAQTASSLSPAMIDRWLSVDRYAVYLAKAGDEALDLYAWNSKLAAAILCDIGHAEVLVRNAFDRQLTAKFGDWTKKNHPFQAIEAGHPSSHEKQKELNKRTIEALKAASDDWAETGHSRIVANLSFGFWESMTRRVRASTHWNGVLSESLHQAAKKTVTRGDLDKELGAVVKLRNRCAHLEPVFASHHALQASASSLSRLYDWFAPQVRGWVLANSAVPSLLDERPAVCAHLAPLASTYLTGDSP